MEFRGGKINAQILVGGSRFRLKNLTQGPLREVFQTKTRTPNQDLGVYFTPTEFHAFRYTVTPGTPGTVFFVMGISSILRGILLISIRFVELQQCHAYSHWIY